MKILCTNGDSLRSARRKGGKRWRGVSLQGDQAETKDGERPDPEKKDERD